MSDIRTGNSAFKQIYETSSEKKALQALVDDGVIPKSYRVIVATASEFGATGSYAVVDSKGDQVHLPAGSHVVQVSGVVTEELTGTGTDTFQLGAALTGIGGASPAAATQFGSSVTLTDANATGLSLTSLLVSTDQWLVVTATAATVVSGTIQFVMVVV